MIPRVNAPKASAKVVMTEFSNGGGWSSMGLAVMAGQLSGIYTQVGDGYGMHPLHLEDHTR